MTSLSDGLGPQNDPEERPDERMCAAELGVDWGKYETNTM